jgi:hypothetical protein
LGCPEAVGGLGCARARHLRGRGDRWARGSRGGRIGRRMNEEVMDISERFGRHHDGFLNMTVLIVMHMACSE